MLIASGHAFGGAVNRIAFRLIDSRNFALERLVEMNEVGGRIGLRKREGRMEDGGGDGGDGGDGRGGGGGDGCSVQKKKKNEGVKEKVLTVGRGGGMDRRGLGATGGATGGAAGGQLGRQLGVRIGDWGDQS